MTTRIIRTRYYLAVEGEGEQSFIKWLHQLCDERNLNKHLDCQLLSGGGYRVMLERAVRERRRKGRKNAKASILLVDRDRADRGDDGWLLEKLKQQASKHNIVVCVQNPNLEGIFLRMMPGKESLQPSGSSVQTQLRSAWSSYKKPADTRTLAGKFTLDDLLRVAKVDTELGRLLSIIELR
jgi:hypothetical protein